jgi:hypothetical protein
LSAVVCAMLVLAAGAGSAAPVPTRDQNPLVASFGIPMPMPARVGNPGHWSVAADINWGSTALRQQRAAEALVVDAEMREVRVTLQRVLSDRFALQLQVPHRYTGGGTLDSFIDGFHDISGTRDGIRPQLPSDQIRIQYTRFGNTQLNINSSSSGLADIEAAIGWKLVQTPLSALMMWLDVKLPTGEADKLTGTGATDASIAFAGERRLADRWNLFGQAAVTWLGEGDLLAQQQRSVLWSGLAGIEWRAWRELSLKVQLDAHSAAFDSDLGFLREPIVLTTGGDYSFRSGWNLHLGLSEDVAVEKSPDVVFVFGVRREL